MSEYRGFTRWSSIGPVLSLTSVTIRWPKLPGRALAPTMAIDRASSSASTADRSFPGARVAITSGEGAGPAAAGLLPLLVGQGGRRRLEPGMPQTPPPAWVAELA